MTDSPAPGKKRVESTLDEKPLHHIYYKSKVIMLIEYYNSIPKNDYLLLRTAVTGNWTKNDIAQPSYEPTPVRPNGAAYYL